MIPSLFRYFWDLEEIDCGIEGTDPAGTGMLNEIVLIDGQFRT